VTATDFNGVANGIGVNNAISYWKDFDDNGTVNAQDYNSINAHTSHTCANPLNP
jgi:hypothetical protein